MIPHRPRSAATTLAAAENPLPDSQKPASLPRLPSPPLDGNNAGRDPGDLTRQPSPTAPSPSATASPARRRAPSPPPEDDACPPPPPPSRSSSPPARSVATPATPRTPAPLARMRGEVSTRGRAWESLRLSASEEREARCGATRPRPRESGPATAAGSAANSTLPRGGTASSAWKKEMNRTSDAIFRRWSSC